MMQNSFVSLSEKYGKKQNLCKNVFVHNHSIYLCSLLCLATISHHFISFDVIFCKRVLRKVNFQQV